MKEIIGSFEYKGEHININSAFYGGGRTALTLDDQNGQRYAVLTVNLPDAFVEDGELLIKTWSENEAIAKAALESGLFVDTGKRVGTGFVEAQIWKFAKYEGSK